MEIGYIYELVFPNNKKYIGQTVNYKRRFLEYISHFTSGRLESKQPKLYKAINKYGWNNIIKNIVIELKADSLENLQQLMNNEEIFYIIENNCIDNGYNICLGGNQGRLGVKTSDETKKRQRNAWTPELRKKLSDKYKGRRVGNAVNIIAVLRYSLDGEFICEYDSISAAARDVGGHCSGISNVCYEKLKYSCNSIWKFKKSNNYPKIIEKIGIVKKQSIQKQVLQFSKSEEFIREYKNLKEASFETGISKSSLSNNCLGKTKSSGGFIWKYKN